ncbi:MAG: pyruvate carboxylase subunit B [Brevinema sp.]
MNTIHITETVLRDGHQSLLATRMSTEDMLPIIEKMDEVGYRSLEVWGGATFDVAMRFLNQDPWERLREIKKRAKKTPLQMLLRGQTLVGYRHYANDTVDLFVRKAIENGIDIVRIFDALNDIKNIKAPIEAVKKYGGIAQVALSYTISPVHSVEFFVDLAKQYRDLGADEIAIKDMAGILLPEVGYQLVSAIKKEMPDIPIVVHTHETAGIGSMLYLRVIEAGAYVIDTAISSLGGGSAQPVTESMVKALEGSTRPSTLNQELLSEIAEYFKGIRTKYLEQNLINIQSYFTEPKLIEYQLPGGMLSNLVSQLSSQNAINRYEEVLQEIPKVRKDFGYPALVTPLSQIVGTQAVMNVLLGERYKICSKEAKDYIQGFYGKSPVPITSEIMKTICGTDEYYTGSPADLVAPEIEEARKTYVDLVDNDEDLLSCILFPQIAKPYLESKKKKDVIEVDVIEII